MWIMHLNRKTVGALLLAGACLSAPTRRKDIDHVGQFNFKVEIEGVTAGQFKNVDGLEAETEVVEYQDGDDPIVRRRPGRSKYSNLTLTRGRANSLLFDEWRQNIMAGVLTKKSGAITLIDDAGRELMRYNFFEAWPSKWRFTDLDGKGGDLTVEEIELAVEQIVR